MWAYNDESLSKLFGRDINIIQSEKNPLIKLKNKENILQFLPFNRKVLESTIFSIFSTDLDKLHFKLANSYQLFIPVNE